jgi:hypothetical protein
MDLRRITGAVVIRPDNLTVSPLRYSAWSTRIVVDARTPRWRADDWTFSLLSL